MTEGQERSGIESAAGGLVWRPSARGAELAVILRAKRHDYALPKGHLDPGETWKTAAVREVFEETGCRVRLGSYAGKVTYSVHGVSKVALFWNMRLVGTPEFQPSREVVGLVWMTVTEALHKLRSEGERKLLRQVAESKWPGKYRPTEAPDAPKRSQDS